METTIDKAVIYARISPRRMMRVDGRLVPVSDTIDQQLESCRQLCEARGWLVVGEFVDRLVSGKNDKRPQYQAMRARALKLKAAVVSYDLSRITRSFGDVVNLLRDLQAKGLPLVTVSGRLHLDTTTAQGRLMAQIFAAVAEFDREVRNERTSWAMQNYYRRLNRPKNPAIALRLKNPPYGSRIENGPDGPRLVTDIAEFKVLQAIMGLYAAGVPARKIAMELNIQNIRNRQGLRWSNKQIAKTVARCKVRRRALRSRRKAAREMRIAKNDPAPTWSAAEKAVELFLEQEAL